MTAVQAPPKLRVRDLKAAYGSARVLHGVDLEVGQGEVVVLLGANGAGKTTTLRAVCGMVQAEGSVLLDGTELLGRGTEWIVRRGVAHVPQGRGVFAELTVTDNLRAGAFVRSDTDAVAADLEGWLDLFPRLGDRRAQPAGRLSGGEQQMLAVARGLMSRPKLLLLDEPSLGLAQTVTRELFAQLARINTERGTAMLIVEQNARLALAFAHRAYVLEAGQVVLDGLASEVRADEAMRRAYLGY